MQNTWQGADGASGGWSGSVVSGGMGAAGLRATKAASAAFRPALLSCAARRASMCCQSSDRDCKHANAHALPKPSEAHEEWLMLHASVSEGYPRAEPAQNKLGERQKLFESC